MKTIPIMWFRLSELIDAFNQEVKCKKYNKGVPYDLYRKLNSLDCDFANITFSNGHVYIEKIRKEHDDNDGTTRKVITGQFHFEINDNSFGTFLYDTFKEELNNPVNKDCNSKIINNIKYNSEIDNIAKEYGIYDWGDTNSTATNQSCCASTAYSLNDRYVLEQEMDAKISEVKVKVQEAEDRVAKLQAAVDRMTSRQDEAQDLLHTKVDRDELDWMLDHFAGDTLNAIREEVTYGIVDHCHAEHEQHKVVENYNKSIDNRKENESMNTNKMFNFEFGPVDANVRMSPYGMAIRNADGKYVSYDAKTGSVMDVEILNFEGHKFMYKMPVAIKDIAVGDVVIHNRKPMFVVNVGDKVTVVDIYNGEEKNILLSKSMFGFDFVTKVVSLMNFGGANAENPFGSMWPFLMMGENADMKDIFMMMALANGGGNATNLMGNPMMMAMLMSGDKDMEKMLPFFFMSQMAMPATIPHECKCGGNCDHQ